MTAAAAGESKGVVSALFGKTSDPSLGNERAGGVVFEASLPVRDERDPRVASDFFAASGVAQFTGPITQGATLPSTVGAAARFLDASRERGYMTRQSFTDTSNTQFGAEAAGKVGVELGAGLEVSSATRTSTGAQFWDGTGWADRTECKK